jgi:hypothetical protein
MPGMFIPPPLPLCWRQAASACRFSGIAAGDKAANALHPPQNQGFQELARRLLYP